MYNQAKSRAHIPNQEPYDVDEEDEDEDDEDKRTIFCANIDQRVTEEILFEVFLQAGPIESVRIPKESGGRQKTFGFVTFVHKCSVPFAINLLAGLSLFKKNLTIKAKYTPGGNNGGGGVVRDNIILRGNPNLYSDSFEGNPFKRDISPPKRTDWGSQSRRSDELKKHSSHNSRPHQNTPYSRTNSSSRDHSGGRGATGGGGLGGGGGGYQSRHNNSRRSEQRRRRR